VQPKLGRFEPKMKAALPPHTSNKHDISTIPFENSALFKKK